jgi:hypothetical protein
MSVIKLRFRHGTTSTPHHSAEIRSTPASLLGFGTRSGHLVGLAARHRVTLRQSYHRLGKQALRLGLIARAPARLINGEKRNAC